MNTEQLVRRVLGLLGKNKPQTTQLCDSDQMRRAIGLWANIYNQKAPWQSDTVRTLGTAHSICAELARLTTMELSVRLSGGQRAAYLQQALEPALARLRPHVEAACATGGLMLKPYVAEGKLFVDFVRAENFFSTAYDGSGRITGAVFVDRVTENGTYYTRLELHNLTADGYYIQNLAFQSSSPYEMGRQIDLSKVSKWKNLMPKACIKGISRPLFGYFKMPYANHIDSGSPLGVSAFSRAVGLMEEADRQYSRLLWEFESGERALFVDEAAFRRDKKGEILLPDRRLYRPLDQEALFADWSPAFRDQSLMNGLDTILMKIEDCVGVARGTISYHENQSRTATELRVLRQRSYATVSDLQKALRAAVGDLLYAMDVWASLYHLAPATSFEAAYEFDDSTVSDRQAEFEEKTRLVEEGIMEKWEFRMWYFGETEGQAKAMLSPERIDNRE